MSFVKCYDITEMVLTEFSKKNDNKLKMNSRKLSTLKNYCEIIDNLAERFEGTSCDAEVDSESTDIVITLVCHEFEIEEASDEFYLLTEKAKSLRFKKYDDEVIIISFAFDGIWEQI